MSKNLNSFVVEIHNDSSPWAKSLICKINFAKRRKNSSKLNIQEGVHNKIEFIFLHEILSKLWSTTHHLCSNQFRPNPNQIRPSWQWNPYNAGRAFSNNWAIAGSADKRINGAQQRVFQRSRDNFLSGSSQSYSNPKLFPNTVESLEVIIPYVKNQQRQVKLSGGRSCPWRFERSKHLHCQGTCEHDRILPVTWFIGKRVCQTFFEINSTNATLIWY